MFSKQCKKHMKDAGMTRWQHFKFAMGIAFQLELTACALFIHAIAPRYFKTYGSEKIKDLYHKTTHGEK